MLRDPKHLHSSPVRVETYGSHVRNRALARDKAGPEEQDTVTHPRVIGMLLVFKAMDEV